MARFTRAYRPSCTQPVRSPTRPARLGSGLGVGARHTRRARRPPRSRRREHGEPEAPPTQHAGARQQPRAQRSEPGRPQEPSAEEEQAAERGRRHHAEERAREGALRGAARGRVTRELEQRAVLDPRRAHRLARPAAETAVDVRAERVRGGIQAALHDGLHEVETAARRVGFVAEPVVRRTRGQAEPAVHARKQSLALLFELAGEAGGGRAGGAHSRHGHSTLSGSKTCSRLRTSSDSAADGSDRAP